MAEAMSRRTLLFCALPIILATAINARAQDLDELLSISLTDLMEMDVSVASGIPESILEAPAAIVVITAEDIRQRGYTSLAEVVVDLPGFDTVLANGIPYLYAYQRGYRHPSTQRTLLLIDGQVDNHLWTHQAVFSRRFPLSSIERVEVLYGPASALYGPNAFLGIINIVTHDGSDIAAGEQVANIRVHGGSYDERGVDGAMRGNLGDVAYSVSARVFKSDEPDLSGEFGFIDNEDYGSENTWGPILDLEHRDVPFGSYFDPTDDHGVLARLKYGGAKIGLLRWVRKEGYGPQYAADRVQNNISWNSSGTTIYGESERQLDERVKSRTLLSYRTSRTWGGWPEALPDWNEGMEEFSYISLTQWNSDSDSWLFKQQFEAEVDELLLTGGMKFERKELTKAYDIPGYWNVFSSTVPSNEPGPYGFGAGIGHSSDSTYTAPPPPNPNMPPTNLAITEDIGGFLQGTWDMEPLRFNAGIRYDDNSIYGSSFNPRASVIYKLSEKGAFKLVYGEAFQEPAPIQLWGGWNGRAANPDLEPEKARNIEFITMYQTRHLLHDISFYFSHYDDVIKEEAENAGSRDIRGVEYRGRFTLRNPTGARDIAGYLYYTYTDVTSSIHYDHDFVNPDTQVKGAWVDGDTELGDIAANKVNAGVNVPLDSHWNFNLRGNYVGERQLYSQNPLRNQDETIDSFFVFNGALSYGDGPYSVTLKVANLFNTSYFHPGVEQADSGDDFDSRSLGFRNSLIPQPGRSFVIRASLQY